MIESLTILYGNNQLVDSDFWNGLFVLVLLLRINKFLNSNTQNIICLLFKIGIFIKQHLLGDKLAKNFLKLVNISFIA